jgi:hypothetical protein
MKKETLSQIERSRYAVAKAIFDLLVWIPTDERRLIIAQALSWLEGRKKK